MKNSKDDIDFWIACSGGVDSVVLVRLFKELKKNFGILHCNFKLRGTDSDKDEEFVRDLAHEIDVPIQVRVFDVRNYIKEKGGNTQLAARNLRYKWFEEVKSQYRAKIVLGHHKDDQIETFLLQLRRGGKLKGLSCMTINNEAYIRPLLKYTKVEIYDLARCNNWLWREDLSNKETNYLRNFYRNELIPKFEKNDWLKSHVLNLVDGFQTILEYSESYLNQHFDFSRDLETSFDLWDSWPYWIKHLFISKSGLAPFSVKEIERLRNAPKGKYLKNKFKSIWNEGGSFVITQNIDLSDFSNFQIEIISAANIVYKKGVVFIDKDKVKGELSFRNWKEGESFQPLGMTGRKKISKFLRDRGVLSSEKKNFPLIVDDTNRILGIAAICPDEKSKVDINTNWVYRIE